MIIGLLLGSVLLSIVNQIPEESQYPSRERTETKWDGSGKKLVLPKNWEYRLRFISKMAVIEDAQYVEKTENLAKKLNIETQQIATFLEDSISEDRIELGIASLTFLVLSAVKFDYNRSFEYLSGCVLARMGASKESAVYEARELLQVTRNKKDNNQRADEFSQGFYACVLVESIYEKISTTTM